MKAFKKLLGGVAALSLALSLVGPIPVFAAATKPSMGAAASFSVLAGLSMSSTASNTSVSGNLGLSPGFAASKTGTWTVGGIQSFGDSNPTPAFNAQAAALAAYNVLVSPILNPSDGPFSVGPAWSPAPGVYTDASSPAYTGTITLNGGYNDVWVFQVSTDFTFSGSVILTGNAQPCNVFWAVARDTTIASGSTFVGTLISSRDISFASGATVNGRVIALNSSLVMSGTSTTISGPTCLSAPAGAIPNTGTINVVKHVINDNGGIKDVSDFPLFVNGTPVVSGSTNTFPTTGGIYHVSETNNAGYTQVFSGDCDFNGDMNLNPGNNKFCILTNDDIGIPFVVPPVPPLINVVKVPSPLSLPAGPGSVLYTYTVRNIGTVPMSNVTLVGDTCSPIVLVSGDTNNNNILEVSETWIHTCTTNLTATHTNTVVATGWANGISAVDIASATVIVGQPIVPPLIHVTKVPSTFTLGVGGGLVTYTKYVTNPGTVALSNVQVTDDKCSPLSYISGDTNVDAMLDTSETWIYRCTTNLTATTTNTAVATGVANGLIARDIALATVVVGTVVPTLPETGVAPAVKIVAGGALAVMLILYTTYLIRKRQKVSGR